jgi:hypothetical protein
MYIGVLGYAAFFGLLIGFIDRITKDRVHNPYFLIAVGCGLGQIVGLPRGETFLFLSLWFATFVALVLVFWICGAFFRPLMAMSAPIHYGPPHELTEEEIDDAYADLPATVEPALAEAAYGDKL